MKKLLFLLVMVMSLGFFSAPVAWGEDSSYFLLFHDWVAPEGGQSYQRERVYAYWQKNDIGFELDVFSKPSTDYLNVKSSATFTRGEFSLVGGFLTDSDGADSFGAGLWYTKAYEDIFLFVDVRNFWGLNKETSDFLDVFVSAKHSFGENGRLAAGLEVIYDYWWEGGDRWYLVGPFAEIGLTDSSKFFARASRSWSVVGGGTFSDNSIRIGLEVFF